MPRMVRSLHPGLVYFKMGKHQAIDPSPRDLP
jgi:hypothetical protein